MEQKRGKEEKDRTYRPLDHQEKNLSIKQSHMYMCRRKLMAELVERKTGIEERKSMVGVISSLAKQLS